MSVSATIDIEAIQPATDEYTKMLAVLDACLEAEVAAPLIVLQYFDMRSQISDRPSPEGHTIALATANLMQGVGGTCRTDEGLAILDYAEHSKPGDDVDASYYIDISKLPKGVTKVRIRMRVG